MLVASLFAALCWVFGSAAAPIAVAGPPPEAPAAARAHAHRHDQSPVPRGAVPEGGWPTDAPLREGMHAIRDAVVAAVRDGGEGPALAVALRQQVDLMMANCRLDPAADAALHEVIAELLRSAGRLESGATPAQEHDPLHAALVRYGRGFNHPGWAMR